MDFDGKFEIRVRERDWAGNIGVLPCFEGHDGFHYFTPEGNVWKEHTVSGSKPISDENVLNFNIQWAKMLYEQLREIFDPKDTVSVDAIQKMDDHLQDMRKIAFKKLQIDEVK